MLPLDAFFSFFKLFPRVRARAGGYGRRARPCGEGQEARATTCELLRPSLQEGADPPAHVECPALHVYVSLNWGEVNHFRWALGGKSVVKQSSEP